MNPKAQIDQLMKALAALNPGACPTCRYWFGSPLIACDRDGTVRDRSEWPTCPDCGREIAQRRELHIVGFASLSELFGERGV